MTDEIWKQINGFNNYFVSINGRVKNTVSGRILKQHGNGNGYQRVDLCKNGQKNKYTVHRLVLEMFLGPCPDGEEADHIDRIRSNNQFSNLRWVPHSKNSRNRNLFCNNQSGLRGVSKSCKRWRAQLRHQGQRVLRCTFATKREAALAYIGALSLIDEEDAANVQAEYDAYVSSSDEE
tara:strand:- start:1088 stop:1621 length:534 start_codon:yes stop_codon:yes gene_type:complete